MERLATDGDLQEELRSVAVEEGDELAVSTDDLVRLAASKGHHFRVEDVQSAAELTDNELESVAGGVATARKLPGRLKWNDITLKRGTQDGSHLAEHVFKWI